MAKNPSVTGVDETAPTPSTSRAPLTKWEVLEKAKLNPKTITCEGYKEFHLTNEGCHTRLPLTAEHCISHMEAGHGGGFLIELRQSEGQPWKGWATFKEKGMEIVDLRCDVCNAEIPINAQHILKHLRPHSGKMRRPQQGGLFGVTLSFDRPIESEEDAYLNSN